MKSKVTITFTDADTARQWFIGAFSWPDGAEAVRLENFTDEQEDTG